MSVRAARQRVAAAQQFRAFGQRNFDIARRGLDLIRVHLRADFDRFIEAVADLQLFRARDKSFGELGGNSLLQQDAARRRASLPRRPERAPQRAIKREIEIGVVEHDLRVLAAHLKRDLLEGGGSALRNQ